MAIRSLKSLGLVTLFVCLIVSVEASFASSKLGSVEFPTSGSPEAQKHFIRGLAALHSFWYKEALESFRKSTQADQSFAMGYWGQAMAYNHPLWEDQDTAAAQAALAKIGNVSKITARETLKGHMIKTD